MMVAIQFRDLYVQISSKKISPLWLFDSHNQLISQI